MSTELFPTYESWDQAKEDAESCRNCPLWEPATQTVFGEGPVPAEAMLVGEQPGDQEDVQGRPFVGPAGRVLNEALEAIGADRTATYVTNAVKHFKFKRQGKRRLHQRPEAAERRACRPWLDAELALVQPRLLVLLGATAAQGALGPSVRVTKVRGTEVESELADHVAVTVHPSSILRGEPEQRHEAMAAFTADLDAAYALL